MTSEDSISSVSLRAPLRSPLHSPLCSPPTSEKPTISRPTSFIKTVNQLKSDTDLLDKRIALLDNELINKIREHINFDESYETSIFRPKFDLAMLLFKKSRKSPSDYTLNLLTLKPTINSINKTLLSDDIISQLEG